jgi:LPXTG-motif cell wall-anchored protein
MTQPRRASSRSIIGSAVAGVLALVGIVFAALSCSSPGPTTPSGATTTVVPVTVPVVPPLVTVTAVPQPTIVVTTVYVPPKSVNSGSGGAADPGNGLDAGTVVLLLGGAVLVVGGGIALVRRRRVS